MDNFAMDLPGDDGDDDASAVFSVVPPEVPIPVIRPKIGNVIEGVAWTGGKPSLAWSSSALVKPTTPLSFRPSSLTPMTKNWSKRTQGRTRLYKLHDAGLTLVSFATATQTHMNLTGMDSIFYVPSEDNETMINVLSQFQRTTLAHVRAQTRRMQDMSVYDTYDEENFTAAMIWLQASLDPDLLEILIPRLQGSTSPAVLWMLIATQTYTSSVQRFRILEQDTKNLRLASYPGENVNLYAIDVRKNCRELQAAGQLRDDLVLSVITTLSLSTSESFRFTQVALHQSVDKFLRQISHHDDKERIIDLDSAGYSISTILDEAEAYYLSLLSAGQWSAAKTTKDSDAPPPAFAGIAGLSQHDIQALAATLHATLNQTKGTGTNDSSEVICFHCQEKGHVKVNCPNLNKKAKTSRATPAWKSVAPAAGEPETKTVDSKVFFWCATCAKWWTSHGTAQHTKGGATPTPPLDKPAAKLGGLLGNQFHLEDSDDDDGTW
jgi:DNA-binding transcriptional MerR regulator